MCVHVLLYYSLDGERVEDGTILLKTTATQDASCISYIIAAGCDTSYPLCKNPTDMDW